MSNNSFSQENGLKLLFRAFRYRNYSLFFAGQSISLIGIWMQGIAMSWLVYRLTNSALLLGLVGFAGQIPTLLFGFIAGVLVDRYSRHHILIVTQILSMIQALMLAFLVLTGNIQIWQIIGLCIFIGLVNAFDMPARQAFTVELVEKKEDLGNAIALNSSMFNLARLVGPSIAGVLIVYSGEGICFFINAITYLGVIASLFMLKIKPKETKIETSHIGQEMKEGFNYVFGFAPIKCIILLLGLMSLIGMSYVVLMPIFAKDILQGGPQTLGFLMAASGIGALLGGIYLASRKSVLGLKKIIPLSTTIFGLGIIAFSQSKVLWLSLILMLVSGFGMMLQMASANTIIQTIVDDDKRGRVMAVYTIAFMGMLPFGSLLAGGLGSKIGASNTLLISGVSCILGAFFFARKLPLMKEMVQPIYVRMGIIPEYTQIN
ncbi:MAG: MFS transporter [bacterium]